MRLPEDDEDEEVLVEYYGPVVEVCEDRDVGTLKLLERREGSRVWNMRCEVISKAQALLMLSLMEPEDG